MYICSPAPDHEWREGAAPFSILESQQLAQRLALQISRRGRSESTLYYDSVNAGLCSKWPESWKKTPWIANALVHSPLPPTPGVPTPGETPRKPSRESWRLWQCKQPLLSLQSPTVHAEVFTHTVAFHPLRLDLRSLQNTQLSPHRLLQSEENRCSTTGSVFHKPRRLILCAHAASTICPKFDFRSPWTPVTNTLKFLRKMRLKTGEMISTSLHPRKSESVRSTSGDRLCQRARLFSSPHCRQVTWSPARSVPLNSHLPPSWENSDPLCVGGLWGAWCDASLLTDLVPRMWVWECQTKVRALPAVLTPCDAKNASMLKGVCKLTSMP